MSLLQDTIDQESLAEQYPRANDIGLRSPVNDSGLHIREDGVVELYSGGVRLVLDGNNNTLTLLSPHLLSLSGDTNLISDTGSLGLNNQAISHYWKSGQMLTPKADLSKLYVFSDPDALSPGTPLSEALSSRELLTPSPAPYTPLDDMNALLKLLSENGL